MPKKNEITLESIQLSVTSADIARSRLNLNPEKNLTKDQLRKLAEMVSYVDAEIQKAAHTNMFWVTSMNMLRHMVPRDPQPVMKMLVRLLQSKGYTVTWNFDWFKVSWAPGSGH